MGFCDAVIRSSPTTGFRDEAIVATDTRTTPTTVTDGSLNGTAATAPIAMKMTDTISFGPYLCARGDDGSGERPRGAGRLRRAGRACLLLRRKYDMHITIRGESAFMTCASQGVRARHVGGPLTIGRAPPLGSPD